MAAGMHARSLLQIVSRNGRCALTRLLHCRQPHASSLHLMKGPPALHPPPPVPCTCCHYVGIAVNATHSAPKKCLVNFVMKYFFSARVRTVHYAGVSVHRGGQPCEATSLSNICSHPSRHTLTSSLQPAGPSRHLGAGAVWPHLLRLPASPRSQAASVPFLHVRASYSSYIL